MSDSTQLVHYDQARIAVYQCVRVDEAASIRDAAAKLTAYARLRDDKEMEVWVREIQLRACIKIGELSRELEKAEVAGGRGGQPELRLPSSGKSKADALSEAGISTSTAHRYEELAGGREEQAQASGKAAAEAYFARSRADMEPATMDGLKGAVRDALVATLGEPPPRRPKSEPISGNTLGNDWVDWTGAVQVIADDSFDLESIAERSPAFIPMLFSEAKIAARRLSLWIELLSERKV